MVEAYSPPCGESEVADILEAELKRQGFSIRRDAVGNVIGEAGSGSPRILLCGHMDTVPIPLPTRLTQDTLHGRGAADAKGPLAALTVAAGELAGEGFPGTLIVAGAVEEEGSNTGVKSLIGQSLDADYAVFGEPTNVDTVTVGYKGSFSVHATFTTETGHSSAPWLYENAVEKAVEAWGRIKQRWPNPSDPENTFSALSNCLRYIEGGSHSGTVPGRCTLEAELRVPPPMSSATLAREVKAELKEYASLNPRVKVTVELDDTVEPYLADQKSKLVKAFTQSIWKARGRQVRLIRKAGTGDMNYYGAAYRIPIVTYGPGDPHLDHTPEERILIQDYLDSIEILKRALNRLVEFHNQKK